MINKWKAKMRKMRLHSVRDPPGKRGGGSSSENLKNIVIQRTEIVIKFKKNILNNYFSWTLPRKDFFT